MSAKYMMINHTKRLYVSPRSLSIGGTLEEFAEFSAYVLSQHWAGDSVELASSQVQVALLSDIISCDPVNEPFISSPSSYPCQCKDSGKSHWRQDYEAVKDFYIVLLREADEAFKRYRLEVEKFRKVCVCGHLSKDHIHTSTESGGKLKCGVGSCNSCTSLQFSATYFNSAGPPL